MDKIEQLKQQKQYEAYVKKKTPQHNVWFNMMKRSSLVERSA